MRKFTRMVNFNHIITSMSMNVNICMNREWYKNTIITDRLPSFHALISDKVEL